MAQTILTYRQFATETQLTATGATQALDVSLYSRVTCQYIVANINTSVTVRLEGSCDGTNWFNLSPTDTDTTKTANGTYAFVLDSIALHRVRFNFVSEAGGTAATIDVRMVAN